MAHRRHRAQASLALTAMVFAIAVIAASVLSVAGARADASRELAAELLIVRGDLMRLERETGLSPLNKDGLRQRIAGALGLLPWLLRETGDAQGADRLRLWQGRPPADAAGRAALISDLDALIARHAIDRDAFLKPPPTADRLGEARAIHETYCAGCHDNTGGGAPDMLLPARDLFATARQASGDEFLARLVNGVKGDASMLFANPLTDAQIGALLTLYATSAR